MEQCHGKGHSQELNYQDTHADGSEEVLIIFKPLFNLLVAAPSPEHVGGVAATLLIMLLTAAVRHHLFFQSLVPICVTSYATTLPLSLNDIPGISQPNVVVCVVESKSVFQVLLCILTDLIRVDEEKNEQNQLSQQNNQQDNEEAQKQALVFLDGAQASEEACHHDNGAYGDDHVGSGERGEGWGEGGEAALRHRQPDSNSQQPTATQPKDEVEDEHHVFQTAQAASSHVALLELCQRGLQ